MGNELNETQLKECRGDNGLLTIGEVGCVLSHLKVCKDFYQRMHLIGLF